MTRSYDDFLRDKMVIAPTSGFDVPLEAVNPIMKPHARVITQWLVAGGRRACFAAFGLHKTMIQIEAVRIAREQIGGMGLIVLPLGVRQEFTRDAEILRTGNHPKITNEQRAELAAWLDGHPERAPHLKFIRRIEEATDPDGLYLTNYETVRDGKLDPRLFNVASLDEASCLRGFGGSKTFRNFMALFAGDDRAAGIKTGGIPYRFVATATPSPNEYIELLAYAAFLGVMDVGQAKTRFFKRNSEKADHLTLHPHKEKEFWLWIASWALFVQKPSDLGFSDEGYELPPLEVHWHEIPADHTHAGVEKDGQMRMLAEAAVGIQSAAAEKRRSLPERLAKLMEIRAEDPEAHRLLWHDLEAERHALEAAIPDAVSVYGSQDLDAREQAVIDFSDGKFNELAAKPVIAGSGCNFQRHCWWAIFMGIGFKFNDFIQAIHRIQRFLQEHGVRIDLIYTEAERHVRRQLERKWRQHDEMVAKMTAIIREFGLTHAAMASTLTRSIGVERIEASGEGYKVVNNDCVLETRSMKGNSVGLIVTSIPFATQYEYTPSYNDFGHTDNNGHFWEQMDYLVPELLRVLQPGRIAAIHVKDRVTPGGINGLGFQTMHPFSDECRINFQKHGFAYLGRKTIVTDVVRENAQTYRLGWTEQCKDGSRMGCGTPEYVLIFRKPPTDNSNGYADLPVEKRKPDCIDDDGHRVPWRRDLANKHREIIGDGFSRGRWQFDAHGFERSSGNRPLTPEELEGLDQATIFRLFRKHSLENVYDFRHDVRIAEHVDKSGWLPSSFMLLQPQSWHPDVWTDITRMRTLNGSQAAKGKEMHLCPLQFDIVERCIEQYSMAGETVLDPFGGLMTVPYCAIKMRRKGIGIELNPAYYLDGAAYCAAAAREMSMPDMFDALEIEQENAA